MSLKNVLSIILLCSAGFVCAQKEQGDYGQQKPMFIDQIRVGEFYSIQAETRGCFSFSTDYITISRDDEGYAAQLNGLVKVLDSTQLDYLRSFEKELRALNRPTECTTSVHYRVKYGNEVVEIQDSSCSWGGIYDLKRTLGFTQ